MNYSDALKLARDLRKNQTPAEKFFWERVRNRKFLALKFNRQFIIPYAINNNITNYFIADFHCFEKRLIVEIDGPIHSYQKMEDERSQDILEILGYHVIRFKNIEVMESWNEVECKLSTFINCL